MVVGSQLTMLEKIGWIPVKPGINKPSTPDTRHALLIREHLFAVASSVSCFRLLSFRGTRCDNEYSETGNLGEEAGKKCSSGNYGEWDRDKG